MGHATRKASMDCRDIVFEHRMGDITGVLQNNDIVISNIITPKSDYYFNVGQYRLKFRNLFCNRVGTGNVTSVDTHMYFGQLNPETGASDLYWKSDADGITPIKARDLGSSNALVNKIHASNVDIGGEQAATKPWVTSVLPIWSNLDGKPTWLSEFSLNNVGPYMAPTECNNDDVVITQSQTPATSGSLNLGQHLLPYRNIFSLSLIHI